MNETLKLLIFVIAAAVASSAATLVGFSMVNASDYSDVCSGCTSGGTFLTSDPDENTIAIQAELDALGQIGLGKVYKLPEGATIPLGDPDGDGVALHIRSRVSLDASGTRLLIPPGVTGIRVEKPGAWSQLRNLWIEYPGPKPHSGVGLEIVGHGIRVDGGWIERAGTAVRVTSNRKMFPEEITNANSVRLREMRLNICHEHGLWLEGSDVNAGIFEGFDMRGCDLYDDSFLGNVHIGHTIYGTGAGYTQNPRRGANYSTLVGNYLETGGSISTVSAKMTTLGGNMVPAMPTGDRVGYGHSRLTFRDGDVRVSIPQAAGNTAMYVKFRDDPYAWSLHRNPGNARFGWRYNGVQPVQLLPNEGEFRARYHLGEEAP